MTTSPKTLSFAGCTSRAEAVARFEPWLDEIGDEAQTRFQTSIIANNVDAQLDVDELADACSAARDYFVTEGRPVAIAQFLEFLDEHLGTSA